MFGSLVNLSPNFVNKDKKLFCLQSLVLLLSISTPSGLICGSGFNP